MSKPTCGSLQSPSLSLSLFSPTSKGVFAAAQMTLSTNARLGEVCDKFHEHLIDNGAYAIPY